MSTKQNNNIITNLINNIFPRNYTLRREIIIIHLMRYIISFSVLIRNIQTKWKLNRKKWNKSQCTNRNIIYTFLRAKSRSFNSSTSKYERCSFTILFISSISEMIFFWLNSNFFICYSNFFIKSSEDLATRLVDLGTRSTKSSSLVSKQAILVTLFTSLVRATITSSRYFSISLEVATSSLNSN